MNEQKRVKRVPGDQSHSQQSVTSMLPPANPIISRTISQIDERVAFRLDTTKPPPLVKESSHLSKNKQAKPQSQQRKKEPLPARKSLEKMTLINGYEPQSLIFLKHDNQDINGRGKIRYFSSMFISFTLTKILKMPQYKGMICQDDNLVFESNFESGNLMGVFKIDSNTYDLVLQNDLNTKGFTQWYNFRVRNKKTNFIAKFNIVNLYKTKSLYNIGMKPIVRSQKSDKNNKKVWRRRGFNIFYQKNDLNYEDNPNKSYKTLSFQYDFTTQNDIVQFAHCIPYDLSDLRRLLEEIKDHPKVSVSAIGTTIMGRSIPLIKISSNEVQSKIQKKALIFMSRQHPGETPGSFVMEEMMLQLLRNTNEVEFLTWRYDIYIFPMVNIDGVTLGNYRGNFAGFDLNRCWLKPEQSKQPEVLLIKNAIRKILKKQQIELILDLHGHSRKMGSFFYGNDFGSNHMLFPYIASKLNRNILFDQSKFTHQTENDPKFSTARVVLGNFLKQSGGYVYTYQVSFYGYYKQNSKQPFSFNEQHYKQLGKSLVVSIYRTYLEIYKQQKSLKESAYLKNIKGELNNFERQNTKVVGEDESQSGSDSEAEQDMVQEIKAIQQFIEESRNSDERIIIPQSTQSLKKIRHDKKGVVSAANRSNIVNLNEQAENQQNPRVIVKSSSNSNHKEFKEFGLPVERYNQEIKRKIEQLLDKNMENDFKHVIAERLPRVHHREHLKSQQEPEKEQRLNPTTVNHSALIEKTPHLAYLEYLKLKKQQRQCETNLHVHGATFGFQGRKGSQSICNPKTQDSKISRVQKAYNFMIGMGKDQKNIQSKNRSSKSYHTIDLNRSSVLNKQQQALIEQKAYSPKKKFTTNHYLVKQQGQEGLNQPKEQFQCIPKSALQVQRLNLKTPSNNQYIPNIHSMKSHSRVKLPSI